MLINKGVDNLWISCALSKKSQDENISKFPYFFSKRGNPKDRDLILISCGFFVDKGG